MTLTFSHANFRRGFAWAAMTLAFLSVAGCAGSTAVVQGKIAYKGQHVPTGEIHFVGADGASRSSPIGSDGSYSIIDCPLGTVTVFLVAEKAKHVLPPGEIPKSDEVPAEWESLTPPELISLIPRKYNKVETSGLSYHIARGRQTIDIVLTD